MNYEWTEDMREISGFGGSYETACRAMASAGAKWLDDHPDTVPIIKHYENITGVIIPENDAAKTLEKVMLDAKIMDGGQERRVGDDCTGAMLQFSTAHALRAHKVGWAKYAQESREMRKKELAK